ncbi:M1 family metallopeptidase [Aggregicoccus sp. 17bor-14]|uniref:hypothetical protein n=1 Tax=Myxococcaceae TaxID=31 RepID=UPI00129D15C0|nr:MULTISPECIES: hypothetical protein [Myxococcaceae]MBF5041504.1 hypothetical protein [Simulacricoccus sp. 17bor-14]MRI87288.1 M1 family metallopeptidase [Aggregicoccus sp. 17bor-14]
MRSSRALWRLAPVAMLALACGTPETPLAGVATGNGGGRSDATCASGDLVHAPAPVDAYGRHLVPIDLERTEAAVVFDAAAKRAQAEVRVDFTMGVEDGQPLFDLRQRVSEAWLDGAPVNPAAFVAHDLGGGRGAQMLGVDVTLRACSRHTLVLRYPIGRPDSPRARPPEWNAEGGRVAWDFYFTDLIPGRYLEMWLPANLLYDRFALSLDLELRNVEIGHTLVTNGQVERLGESHWHVDFPPTFTAFSPMVVLAPADFLEAYEGPLTLVPGRQGRLALFRERTVHEELRPIASDIAEWVAEFTRSTGTYVHDDALSVYLWSEPDRSMEYDGGTTSSREALEHELFHSWYGRGVKPARQADGWIDEAWNVYTTDPRRGFRQSPLCLGGTPVELSPQNPWTRVTAYLAYTRGAQFFGTLAALLGEPVLLERMRDFYAQHANQLVTTGQLEQFLAGTAGDAELAAAFRQQVYGGAAPADEPTACLR